MTTFSYDDTEPDANEDPSVSQPIMLNNSVSLRGIWDVDHVGFGVANGGTHLQVTYSSENVPGVVSGTSSVAYTNAGTADATKPQNFFKNANGIFPLSAIKAFTNFTCIANNSGPTAIVSSNSFNIASISGTTSGGNGSYTVTLTAGSYNTDNICVLTTSSSSSSSSTLSYTFTGGVLTLAGVGLVSPAKLNVVFIQI